MITRLPHNLTKLSAVCLMFTTGFTASSAESMAQELLQERGPVIGRVSATGVTFATERDAQEALQRGEGDSRNPFVGQVLQMDIFDGLKAHSSTVTLLTRDILLCVKHALPDNIQAIKLSSNEKGMSIKNIKIIAHCTEDLALVKFVPVVEETSIIPGDNFIQIAGHVLTETLGQGFVVSHGCVSIVNQEKPHADCRRAISIHNFDIYHGTLDSELGRKLSSQQLQVLNEYCFVNNFLRIKENTYMAQRVKDILPNVKKIEQDAEYIFPDTKRSSMRLISALKEGASGSPLIIKRPKGFEIVGIFVGGEGESLERESSLIGFFFIHHFINLSAPKIRAWITESVAELKAYQFK